MTATADSASTCECGNRLKPSATYCGRCGRPVASSAGPAGAADGASDSRRASSSSSSGASTFGGPRPDSTPTSAPAASTPRSTAPEHDLAAQGGVRQNQTYVGNRLMFTRNGDIEGSFLNIVAGGAVWGHLRGVLVFQVVLFVLYLVLATPFFLWSAAASASSAMFGAASSGPSISGVISVLLTIVWLVAAVIALVVAFTGRIQTPMSEWQLLVDDRSVSGDSAYAAIALALRRRAVPAEVLPTRMQLDVTNGEVGNFLVVSRAPYVIYISVLPYGTGLYLSWLMMREEGILGVYREWFRQYRNRRAGAGTLLHYVLRSEGARALRETVHNAVREGVETAVAQRAVDVRSAFAGPPPPVQTGPAPSSAGSVPRPPRPGL